MPRDTKRPTTRIPAKPIDPIVLNRGDFMTARAVLMRHEELVLAALLDAHDMPRETRMLESARAEVNRVRRAIEHIIAGWRPGAGGGG